MESKNILMLLSKSAYDALAYYMLELGSAFEGMGYTVEYIDGRKAGYEDLLYERTSGNEYLAIVACNAILTGYEKLVLKNSIFCCLMFDHPVHLYERIQMADERVLIIHCDLKSAEYIARYCPNVGSVGFVPLSGRYIENYVPYSERKYDIVFTGSNIDSKSIYDTFVKEASESDIIVADEIIGIMKENVSLTMQDALWVFLDKRGIVLRDEEFHQIMGQMRAVETYMRAWIRERVVRKIADSGYRIHVFGRNWDNFGCVHPENIIMMEGHGDTSLRAVADARLSLNVMPWFRGGFQERIASAMLCGSVALTDTSTYIEENFTDGVDIAIYDAGNIESIPARIADILDNPQKGGRIAKAGCEKARMYHTWDNRAKEIMENIEETAAWFRKAGAAGKDAPQCEGTDKPCVSVIVPVHNSRTTLTECIGNLVAQTLENIEIIFVDDCSTDDSPVILKRCFENYPDKVKVITLTENRGPGGARNEGIKAASGQYIGFADSDDIADITMYEKMYRHAVENGYDIVDTGYYKEETDEYILYTGDDCVGTLDDKKRSELIFGAGGYIWARIFRSEMIKDNNNAQYGQGGVFREKRILEDMDFMLYQFATARSIGTVKEVLYTYRYYDGSISKNTEPAFYRANACEALRASYERLSRLDNFEGIRTAFEAIVYKLYSCMLNQTVKEYCDGKIIPGNPIIKELVRFKDSLTKENYRDNPYVPRELENGDIAVMDRIEVLYHT
ncbi:MAG: glycosyltransferase [Lachnospiraceae bacterium]|nr:glycosyltransferase [Lachnospiraceae bacterium]